MRLYTVSVCDLQYFEYFPITSQCTFHIQVLFMPDPHLMKYFLATYAGRTEENPVREAVISLLSTGPVGISDRIGYTNPDIANA